MVFNRAVTRRKGKEPFGGVFQPARTADADSKRKKKSIKTVATTTLGVSIALLGLTVILIHLLNKHNDTATTAKNPKILRGSIISKQEAQRHIESVKKGFQQRYGSYSNALLEKGINAFGSLDATAERMVLAAQGGRPFVMAFSGYSITVGRGNFFHQSFPFVAESILKEPMEKILGIPLVVRNAAIGGIPSFPYGFCFEHFLGKDPDVISWDYSMNEGGRDASVLEAFVRQSLQQLPKQPMLIMIDQNKIRMDLLKQYTEHGLLQDAIAVGKANILDDSMFKKPDSLPPGFQEWDEFGAPMNCPGRGSWHPKRQEHAMIGWMIAMHFVQAIERAHEIIRSKSLVQSRALVPLSFPKPFSTPPNNDAEVTELLYGHENGGQYTMKHLSCRSSFLPATDESKVLPSIIISGFAEADLDIMIDREDKHYKEGWVLDVSTVERDTKRKVEQCGGLGYIDMKIALYGTPESGPLRLWLPFEGPSHDTHEHDNGDAKHWFDDFIICEANEKRSDKACKLDQDMKIVVGGVEVTSITPVEGAAAYLKRTTCVNVGVPANAQTTTLGNVRKADGSPVSANDKERLGVKDDTTIGLVVDVTARSKVTRKNGACCLSHVVWEMH